MIPTLREIRGRGASPSKFGGGQSRDIFRGVLVKKNHPVLCTLYSTKSINTYVLGPEESHRKLRPNVLREDSTRTGLRYQLDSCPIYGAYGLT